MEIVHGDNGIDCFVAEFIGGAVAKAFLDPGAGQSASEPVRVMIAALRSLLEGGHAAEFYSTQGAARGHLSR